MELFRILVAVALIAIVGSLGSALFHLMTDKGQSKKMVRALTLRVALSVGLFVVLMGAFLHTEYDVTVHLDETPVAVPSEAVVLRGACEGADGLVVEA